MIELNVLTDVVKEAAPLMQSREFDTMSKGGYANIVTSVDVAVQDFLRTRLAEVLPGSGFLCEEEDAHDLGHEYVWIIDPIDGTANFARGIAECAISVGLCRSGEMCLGVVYSPFTGEFFAAQKGCGATLNGRRISVSSRPFADSVLCTALPVYYKEYSRCCSEIILDAFNQCNDLRRFGSAAMELCYLAMGRCDVYFEYRLSPWDFAAASLVLKEAGGCICGLKGDVLDPFAASGIIAANCQDNLNKMVEIVNAHI